MELFSPAPSSTRIGRTRSIPVAPASREASACLPLPFVVVSKGKCRTAFLLAWVALSAVLFSLVDAVEPTSKNLPQLDKSSGLTRQHFRRSIRPHHVPSGVASSLAQVKDDDLDLDLDWDDDDAEGFESDGDDLGDGEVDEDASTDAESDGESDSGLEKPFFSKSFNADEKSSSSTMQTERQSARDFLGTSPLDFPGFGTPSWAQPSSPSQGQAGDAERGTARGDSLGEALQGSKSALFPSSGAPGASGSMYTRAVETAPATNFLGVGYDSIKGNPIGDPDMMVDPGLRSPIIVFSFEQDQDGVTNDLNFLQPLGAYTRPFAACRQSENVSELDTLSDYQKELSVDASLQGGDPLGINSFSGSTGYKEFARDVSSKSNKSFMLKTYCIRYEAGIAQTDSFKWNYTLAFDDALEQLPTTFDGAEQDSLCSVQQWRTDHMTDACQQSNIPKWIGFIEQFGTHYTSRLYAGGKMTYQVTMKSSDVKAMKKKGVDVKAELKIMLAGFGMGASSQTKTNNESASQMRNLNIEKEALVIGGKPPADVSDPKAIASWANSVEALPMPVKLELLPLQNLLPEDKREAFKQAVSYYGKAFGMSTMDLQSLEGTARSIQEVLKGGTQVAWAGAPPGFARCPRDQVVMFGFAIRMNFKVTIGDHLAKYHIAPCTAGREKCDGVGAEEAAGDDERIYMVCGQEVVNEIYQVVAETSPGEKMAVATCPEDTEIAFGFGLSVGTGFYSSENTEIEPCTAGQTRCTKSVSSNTVKAFVWAVCVEKSFPGISQLNNVVEVGSRGKSNAYRKNSDGVVTVTCPEEEDVILGYALEVHTHMPNVRSAFKVCNHGSNSCSMNGAGEQRTVLYVDRHALVGWSVCARRNEEKAHVASDMTKNASKQPQ
ncbi:MAC/Perforin domain containing protein, related [Neospora caninum Liverpool]|uniref:MAC/Perforin domain containing protein, related n=1 Tax=Neospora caninum (strain Liverpool) TaxID=572307 RepID=F0VIZ5_NEOCL|nr:MAC/Perforin domain containing protein, related [Neospora caninum Liverpool]CBZ53706.1 MAC/Perforin domain containing protein, related [Neospora caninum Liverpool]CEL67696.1 TPA: MAC/Perforin domain containing protein, related [Neospora caninum Liverpool]|eukprot:XP_003883738.1 MAC/Perforin domain containing protein, related [Neospora caninum Liverpool]